MRTMLQVILVFTLCLLLASSTMFAQTTYYSTGSVAPNTLANWNSNRDGTSGATPTNFTTSGDIFIIQGTGGGSSAPHTMLTTAVWTIGAGVTVQVEGGATLQAEPTFGITFNATATFQLDAGATYNHNNVLAYASTILAGIENFATTSNFVILNSASTGPGTPSGGGFGNLTINSANTSSVNSAGALTDIKGNLTIQATGGGTLEYRLTGATALTLNIGGNLDIQGGVLDLGNGAANPIINLSGNFSMSGGTLNCLATGGTVSVPKVATLNFNKVGTQTFTKSSGTITAASSSFRHISMVVLNGSILDMGTNILNCLSATNLDFTVNSGGTVRLGDLAGIVVQGTTATTGNIQTSATSIRSFNTGASYDYTGSSAQVTGNGFIGAKNLNIANTSGVALSVAASVSDTLILGGALDNTGAVLTLGNGANIFRGAGSLSAAPTFGTSVNVEYSGSCTTGFELPTSGSVLNNLNIGAAITLGASAKVNGTLTFGFTMFPPGKTITLGSNDLTVAAISGASDLNYIITNGTGALKRTVAASNITFPIGTATTYNPVTINNAGTSDDFSVRVQSTFDNAPVIATQVVDRQWTITEAVGGGSNATITLQWNTADEAGSFVRTNPVYLGRWTGSAWDQTSATYADLGGGIYTAQASGLASFSPFGVGNNGALPVELTSFVAAPGKYNAMLSWNVASEVNAYGYEILRREIGKSDVANVGFVKARGAGAYKFDDANVKPGHYIYELKQVDNDGAYKIYSSAQVVVGIASKELTLGSYPNPFNPTANIEFTLPQNGFATLKVFNVIGQEVATLFSGNVEAGIYNKVTFNASQLSSGMYFSVLESGNQRIVKKMLMTK